MNFELKKLERFRGRSGPLVLLIMDGVGIGTEGDFNAVFLAKTPVLDGLKNGGLYREIRAHGTAVGMPSDEDMGNSEVGHNALGAGRVFDQGAALVQNAFKSGDLFRGDIWEGVLKQVQDDGEGRTLHLMGLLSDGNVHAHVDHLKRLIQQAARDGVSRVRLHLMSDGRDVAGRSVIQYLDDVETVISELAATGCDCKIASLGGRMVITMDRYNADWEMVQRGWETAVLGEGPQFGSAREGVEAGYLDPEINDQYLPPFVVAEEGNPVGTINDGDAVLFFNFRGDRAIEICQAFEMGDDFDRFDRKRVPDVLFVGMMEYDGDLHVPKRFLVDAPVIEGAVSEYFCGSGLRSFAISETQKYGHVTFFWNGNKSGYVDESLETYVEIPSDIIPFDQRPEMKAYEITEKAIELLRSGDFDFGRVNFPNGDMVGHTGVLEAAVKAVEVTDECVGRIIDVVNELGGITVVLADHGNSDDMTRTSHTLSPVPFCIVDSGFEGEYGLMDLPEGGLANVAGTLCNLLGFEVPEGFSGSLIRFA